MKINKVDLRKIVRESIRRQSEATRQRREAVGKREGILIRSAQRALVGVQQKIKEALNAAFSSDDDELVGELVEINQVIDDLTGRLTDLVA